VPDSLTDHLTAPDSLTARAQNGTREWGAHRDTEGGWAGFIHTTGSQGFISDERAFFFESKSL